MANEEEPPAREWEVVTLTASAYAASPSPVKNETTDDENSVSAGGIDVARTSDPLFMSGHFVLPSDHQPENPLVQPENKEIQSVHESEYAVESSVDFGCRSISDDGFKSEIKNQDEINIEGLDISEHISGSLSEFEENDGLLPGLSSAVEKEEESIYSCTELGSSIMTEITAIEEEESSVIIADVAEFNTTDTENNPVEKDYDNDDDAWGELPCGAWWKRKAGSVYAYAKEANAFWSVFVAATVMGLVILGQRWQQENWHILQLKWQSSISDEKMGKMFGPLTRLKDALVGGHRQASFIKGSSSTDH